MCWHRWPDFSILVNYKKAWHGNGEEDGGAGAVGGTFGCFQPLLFDAVADLSLGLAFREVALDDGRVALVHLDLLVVVRLEIPQLCEGTEVSE